MRIVAALLLVTAAVAPIHSAAVAQSSGIQLAAAQRAAWGRPGSTTLSIDGENVRFSGGQLIATSFGPVLVAPGKIERFSHVSPGRVGAFYVRPVGNGFARGRDYPSAAIGGSMGALSDWNVSRNFGPQPVIFAEGGFTGQGLSCSTATLTALMPRGPVTIAQVPTFYSSNANGREIDGKIGAIVPGRSFMVNYTGSMRFTDRYVWSNGRYRLQGRSRLPSC